MVKTLEKVEGMFLGVGIGDALGMPVETFTRERILLDYKGRVTKYETPDGHKWFDGEKAGTWTDDTQLTLAVADALIEAKDADMDAIAAHHVTAYKKTTAGWGRSTKQSVRRLANGTNWSKSAEGTGLGNGTAMKIAPLGLYLDSKQLSKGSKPKQTQAIYKALRVIADTSLMTHRTSLALSASFAQALAIRHAFSCQPSDFDVEDFIDIIVQGSEKGSKGWWPTNGDESGDNLTERFRLLVDYKDYDGDRIIQEFGEGKCYCYDSLPFTYMHFLQDPDSIESLYDVVSNGGDTDTNGSMLAALLGALHGASIFPDDLINGLDQKDRILSTAQRFHATFFE